LRISDARLKENLRAQFKFSLDIQPIKYHQVDTYENILKTKKIAIL